MSRAFKFYGDSPTSTYDPKPVPTIFGSMHAIRKDYFIEIGQYEIRIFISGFDRYLGVVETLSEITDKAVCKELT